jgi:hypothetical protein
MRIFYKISYYLDLTIDISNIQYEIGFLPLCMLTMCLCGCLIIFSSKQPSLPAVNRLSRDCSWPKLANAAYLRHPELTFLIMIKADVGNDVGPML